MLYEVITLLNELETAIEAEDEGMKAAAKTLGLGITDGVIDGIDSTKVNNKIARMARAALATAKRELEQNSPSKKFSYNFV